jgi:hypothetical protein
MWGHLTSSIGAALATFALSACSDFLSSTSDMSNPQSGVYIDFETSFASMPSASVMMLLNSASTMLFVTDDVDGRVCFGLENVPSGKSTEDACLRFADTPKWISHDLDPLPSRWPFPGPTLNSRFDNRVGASLVRDCGEYALHNQDGLLESGAGCGLLGAFLADEGNAEAAKAVWEQAPGCHTHDVFGDPMNGCVRFIVGEGDAGKEGQQWLLQNGYDHHALYSRDKPRLIAMAKAACLNEFDYASCAFLARDGGVNLDIVALRQAVQDRHDAAAATMAERRDATDELPDVMSRMMLADGSLASKAEANSKEAKLRRTRLERNARLKALVGPLAAL